MHLQKLRLINFKNYEEVEIDLPGKVACFLGKNGSGKTNLLDAIHYLSFTRSAITSSDGLNVRRDQQHFFLKGEFIKESKQYDVTCAFGTSQKKILSENGIECLKYSEHVGKFPLVMIAPQDIELIWDGSETRRKFFDSLISQLDRAYLENLIFYTNQLKQRNGLLRLSSERGYLDKDLLAGYDQNLARAGYVIYEKRKQFLSRFQPIHQARYRFLADNESELVDIQYRSDLDLGTFEDILSKNLHRDMLLQRTTAGIHRDDFLFSLDGGELKRMGSQGQQKSFLIALKLAEFDVIAEKKQFKPLLLLDDIFDKLDDDRIHKMMILASGGLFGQIFITDARPQRSTEILQQAGIAAELFHIKNGTATAYV